LDDVSIPFYMFANYLFHQLILLLRLDDVYNIGNIDIYGFLEPQSLQRSGNKMIDIQTYIQNWISESRKRIYFAPIIHKKVSNLYILILSNVEYITLLIHFLILGLIGS